MNNKRARTHACKQTDSSYTRAHLIKKILPSLSVLENPYMHQFYSERKCRRSSSSAPGSFYIFISYWPAVSSILHRGLLTEQAHEESAPRTQDLYLHWSRRQYARTASCSVQGRIARRRSHNHSCLFFIRKEPTHKKNGTFLFCGENEKTPKIRKPAPRQKANNPRPASDPFPSRARGTDRLESYSDE